MSNDLIGILMVAGIVIPAMSLVAYFIYDQKKREKQREKKS